MTYLKIHLNEIRGKKETVIKIPLTVAKYATRYTFSRINSVNCGYDIQRIIEAFVAGTTSREVFEIQDDEDKISITIEKS